MFVPTLCPACTAVVVVADRDLPASRAPRCPCCGAEVASPPDDRQPACEPRGVPLAA